MDSKAAAACFTSIAFCPAAWTIWAMAWSAWLIRHVVPRQPLKFANDVSDAPNTIDDLLHRDNGSRTSRLLASTQSTETRISNLVSLALAAECGSKPRTQEATATNPLAARWPARLPPCFERKDVGQKRNA
jgi:hypothetical protein